MIHGSPAFSGATLWARRQKDMKYYFDILQGVKGGVVESGVHWGYGILIELSLDEDREIYGFDSFKGHSKPTNNDKSGGNYQALDSSFSITENDVWKTLELGTGTTKKELKSRVTLVPGWIQESMAGYLNETNKKIALVHVDCDIYEPFKATLMASWPHLVQNGIIIIGIMDNLELMGNTIAVKEFLENLDSNSYELKEREMYDNGFNLVKQSYIVKKIKEL